MPLSCQHRPSHASVCILLAGWLCFSALHLPGATYHVDNTAGADQNDGLSPAAAWRTLTRANQQSYGAGDLLLLKRGGVWTGPGFRANGNGRTDAPITLADYGSAQLPPPRIDGVGAHEPAVLLQNVQGWTVRNLDLTQHGQSPQALDANNEKGKDADQYSDEYMRAVVHVLGLAPPGSAHCGEECTVRGIRLENLIVHDGSWNGIYVSGGFYQLRTGRFGTVDQVVIQGVESFNHHKAGVEITCTYYQTRLYATSNVWVLDSYLHDNGGDGVMVGPVQNGLLEGNVCAYNGRIRNARVGCWTWDSENTVIQFNESHHNMTPLTDNKARDGAGFDLDLGTENGVIQYNWSHDNQGEGFLVLSWPVGFGFSRGESHNALLRYNLSERDGKKLAGGVTVFGGVDPLVICNNTIYYEPDRLAGTDMFNGEGAPLTTSIFGKSGRPNARVHNNVFITNGRVNSAAASENLWTDGAGTFAFDNNLWWRVEGGLSFQWAGSAVNSWNAWQGRGFDLQGLNADPRLAGPLGRGPAAYRLRADSPAVDRGRAVVEALRGMGAQDAFGVSIPQGASYDIGLAEYSLAIPDPAAARALALRSQPDGWQLRFAGAPGRSYRVDASIDWRTWVQAGHARESSAGVFEFTDPLAAAARFYRVVARGLPGF